MKKIIAFLALVFSTPSVCWLQNAAVESFAADRLVLSFKNENNLLDKTTTTVFDDLNKQFGLKSMQMIRGGGKVRSIVLKFETAIDLQKAISDYSKTGLFQYVEPDFVGKGDGVEACPPPPETTPNDEFFLNRQWGLRNNGTFRSSAVSGNDIKMVDAWNISTGDPSVILAIIDSGAKLNHPEFANRIWTNTREIAGNGIDDDNNGKIDDVRGWNFAYSTNDPTDDYGHGTNVAGIAGATGNNTIGYAGMDWQCKLMILKGLNSANSGFYSWWQDAIYYAVDNGAKVINMSLVGTSNSSALEAAVNYAWNKGVIIAACMGNDATIAPRYPAGFDKLIAVGSIDANGKRSSPFFWSTTSGSNWGPNIDVVAPGNYIYGLSYNSDTNFGIYWGGTSQATPHVAGLLSLILSKNKNLTPQQLKDLVQNTADDRTGDPSEDAVGYDNFYGWGRINALRALQAAVRTATENLSADPSVIVVPNPTSGVFSISFGGLLHGRGAVELVNAVGQIVLSKTVESFDNQQVMPLDLSHEARGIYFLKLSDEGRFMVKKVFVE